MNGSSSKLSFRSLCPAVAVIATLVWASGYDKKGPQNVEIEHFDKIAHFFVYGLLGTLWFRWLPGERMKIARLLGAFGITMLYGVIDEWIQASNPVRTSDAWDWVADGLGALTALLVYRGWSLYRRILETPIRKLCRLEIVQES